MNNSGSCSKSLKDLSMQQLCNSMNEEFLQYMLKQFSPEFTFPIIWSVLRVNNQIAESVDVNKLPNGLVCTINRGLELAKMSLSLSASAPHLNYGEIDIRRHTTFAKAQQTKFVDTCNFCSYFDLDLFFMLVEYTGYRTKLFIVFQICIQSKGLDFPKKFAQEWINRKSQNDKLFNRIEEGLKLGVFLGDASWFYESALVLSHTYEIISTKWVCDNQNLVLTKTIQCLSKWLIVTSNLYNISEAKKVLQNILHTISIFKNLKEKTTCVAYSYVAVSQYYYQLMEFNQAWTWAVKAVNEIDEKNKGIINLLVTSHAVKVSSTLNKLVIAKKLKDQTHLFCNNVKPDLYIAVDMVLNEACYQLKADLAIDSVSSYHMALDTRRNLFGYFSLHTASVFVDYAYARYVCDYATNDFSEAMRSVLQGIYIMKEIGLSDDHLMLVNAGRIKALIMEEKALGIVDRSLSNEGPYKEITRRLLEETKKSMLNKAEELHKKSLESSLKAVGEKSILTAKHYCNLGRLYQSKEAYKLSKDMHLKAIEIKEEILGKDDPEVAFSLGQLASLYTYQLGNYSEAEQLYLRSKTIYETTYGSQYTGLLYDVRGLAQVYYELNDTNKYNACMYFIRRFHERRQDWLFQVHSTGFLNETTHSFSLNTVKGLMNGIQ